MRTILVAAAAALLAGCLGGLKDVPPAPTLYRIDAPTLAAGAPVAADLVVVVTEVAPGLDGPGIAGRWPGGRVDYLAGTRWADPLPRMVQAALVESLQDSGRLKSVQGDLGRFRATHTLVIDVRRFEADYTAGGLPVAQVALAVTLGNSDRRVLTAFTAAASESATANRQASVVAALDAAFARAAGEMADKVLAALAAEPPRAP